MVKFKLNLRELLKVTGLKLLEYSVVLIFLYLLIKYIKG